MKWVTQFTVYLSVLILTPFVIGFLVNTFVPSSDQATSYRVVRYTILVYVLIGLYAGYSNFKKKSHKK